MFSNRILANRPTMEPASYFTHPTRLVLSFEFFLAALTVIGGLKKNPTFAWMFPVDGTAMVFTAVACWLTLHMLKNGIPRYTLQAIVYYILFCLWTVASASWTLVASLESLPDFVLRILLVNGIMLVGTLVVVTRDPKRTVRFMAALTF